MTEEKFKDIIEQIKKGGTPPTVGHRITYGQWIEIVNACNEYLEMSGMKYSRSTVERYVEYVNHWTLKVILMGHSLEFVPRVKSGLPKPANQNPTQS